MIKNTYWCRKGKLQKEYETMEAAGFEYTQATERQFYSYYRYYNDGDLPGWARSRWDITRYSYEYGYRQRVLTEAGEKEQEERLDAVIAKEWKRFQKTQR